MSYQTGWWHPAECSNNHNEHGNCLDADGSVIGWREENDPKRLARALVETGLLPADKPGDWTIATVAAHRVAEAYEKVTE